MPDPEAPENLSGIFDRVESSIEGQDAVTVADLLDAFGARAFGPVLVVPSLLTLSPLGAIPFVPAVLQLVVVVAGAQYLVGERRLWLPRRLRERGVKREKLGRAIKRLRPWARRVDRFLHPRLEPLVSPPIDRVFVAVAMLLSLALISIGFVPFAPWPPAIGIAVIGLGISTRDGVAALLGLLSCAATAWIALSIFG